MTVVGPVSPVPPARPWPLLTRWRQGVSGQTFILLVVVAIVAFLALVPIVYLLRGTFIQHGALTLSNLKAAYTADGLPRMILNSFEYAAGATLVALVCGTSLAYLVARTDVPLKGLVYVAALVPLIIPGVLHTIAWIFLASEQIGSLNTLLKPVFGSAVLNIYSMKGMIFVEGIHNAPLVFLLMFAAFRNMDSSMEESALMSGASMPRVIGRITLPMVRPALYLATLIMLIRTLSSFEVPQLIGTSAGYWVFTSRIFNALKGFPVSYGLAGAYSLGLLLILALLAGGQSRLSRNAKSYQTVTGKAFRPTTVRLRGAKPVATAFVLIYFVVASVLPLAILVYASLTGFYSPISRRALSHLTFANYNSVFSDAGTATAFKNSIILAIASATIIMLLTSVVSWIVVRSKIRGAGLLNGLTMIPIGIPGLIMGVALLFTYLRIPIHVYGTLFILLIAYVTVFLPYGITYSSSAMYQISNELEESARVSGASWWFTFRRVTLPLLMPGFVAGWTFIVLVAFRELGASLLLYTPGKEVLSILIWQEWGDGLLSQLAALGVVMILLLMVLVAVARKLGAKVGVQSL